MSYSFYGALAIGGSSRDAAWTNAVGVLIGNELVNIVIEQNLEIAGGDGYSTNCDKENIG